MKSKMALLGAAVGLSIPMLFSGSSFAAQPVAPAPAVAAAPAQKPSQSVRISLDKGLVNNSGVIEVSGTAPAGAPVYIEVWSKRTVRADLFDTKRDKKTGKTPYILYSTEEMPAYYRLLVPADKQGALKAVEGQGKKWSFSKALASFGAMGAFKAPAAIHITRYHVSVLGSVIGSRGKLLPAMNATESADRAMQLLKKRFGHPGAVFASTVQSKPDGAFTASIAVPQGSPGGAYQVRAVSGAVESNTLSFENHITFPNVYLSQAGTTMNLFWPFLLSFAVCTFGVLMGAGGGFILNPLLVLIWPLPPAVVAGTVMPTVLFSQASGIYNYSKIKFISWKLGIAIGLAMLLGGFIGPELTELITLSQFKFVFGIILIFLAGLMAWQTTPSYVAKNKKEKAILQQFQKKAQEAAAAKKGALKPA